MDNTDSADGIKPKNRGGRPRKPADPAFPKRLNTASEIYNHAKNEHANAGNDGGVNESGAESTADIIVSASEKAETAQVDDDSENQQEVITGNELPTYYCQDCEFPLTVGDKYCPGCKGRLQW